MGDGVKRLRAAWDLITVLFCFAVFLIAFAEDSEIGYARAGLVFLFLGLLELIAWHGEAKQARRNVTNIHISGPGSAMTGKAMADELLRYRRETGR